MEIGLNKTEQGYLIEPADSSKSYDVLLKDEDINLIYKIYMKIPLGKVKINKSELEEFVSSILNVTPYSLYIKTRKREIVYGKQIIFYVFYITRYGSLARIGALYNKDHATVIHAVHQCEKALEGYNGELLEPLRKTLIYFNLWDFDKSKPKVYEDEEMYERINELVK